MAEPTSLRRAPWVVVATIDGESVLFDRGRIHRLDQTGTTIYELLDGTRDEPSIIDELSRRYMASSADIQADVRTFIEDLRRNGLIDEGADPPPAPEPATAHAGPEAALGAHFRETRSFRALPWQFSIRSNDAPLERYLHELMAPFEVEAGPAHAYEITRDDRAARSGRWTIRLDGDVMLRTGRAWLAIAWMLWHTNQQAILHEREHVLLHASAAALDGRAVVIPGPMNAGKTTLVAALALSGFGYVTDEAVAIELGSSNVTPYPRAMGIGPGSQSLLVELRPPPSWRTRYQRRDWHIDGRHLGAGTPRGSVPVSLVIIPHLAPGETSELQQIGRAETLEAMSRTAWNLTGLGAPAFETLVGVVRGADCGLLRLGDLDSAVRTIRVALEGVAT